MFISIIGDKNVERCPVLDLVNAINDVNVGISTLGCAVISDEMCCMCDDEWSTDLNRYYTIVSRWYLKVDFTVPIVALQLLVCIKVKYLPFHCI